MVIDGDTVKIQEQFHHHKGSWCFPTIIVSTS